ncbi:MAG TPA: hypothetical protein PLI45_01780 [Candidatus Woesebacteria bacterium]|nr:hypothetical protein [Candidatus Woesebacteria bacterium]
MKINLIKSISLILFPIFIYIFQLGNYFSGDDWFHLRISNVDSLSQFLNFFSFSHTAQSAAFYRPLPTQVFFFSFQKLFGLTAWPYYLFVLLCFGFSLYLVYRFAKSVLKEDKKSIIATFIYGISVSNFTRLYFLSAFQEISLVIFSILCLLNFEKSKVKSLIFFILALLSKETAIVLPVLILILNYQGILKKIKQFLPFVMISLIYLYLRFSVFGIVEGDSYVWNFSPSKTLNTLSWYVLWSFGAPELLVDYIGSGFRPIPRLFTDYPYWWQTIFILLGGTVFSFIGLLVKKIKHINRLQVVSILLFVIPLLPVIFLPQHKFALELGLPLVGFSLGIASVFPKKTSLFSALFVLFYIALNLSMNYLTYTRHYSVNRSKTARQIVNYFSSYYPQYPQGSYFEFINDTDDYGKEWGSSKQISNITSGSELFRVLYKDNNLNVYFQDYLGERPNDKENIEISTKQFFQVQ